MRTMTLFSVVVPTVYYQTGTNKQGCCGKVVEAGKVHCNYMYQLSITSARLALICIQGCMRQGTCTCNCMYQPSADWLLP